MKSSRKAVAAPPPAAIINMEDSESDWTFVNAISEFEDIVSEFGTTAQIGSTILGDAVPEIPLAEVCVVQHDVKLPTDDSSKIQLQLMSEKIADLERKLAQSEELSEYWKKCCSQSMNSSSELIRAEVTELGCLKERITISLNELRNIRLKEEGRKCLPVEFNTNTGMFLQNNSISYEYMFREITTVVQDIEDELSLLSLNLTSTKKSIQPEPDNELIQKLRNDFRINLTSFGPNDVALFFPTPRGDFLAFHIDCPHHYLSEESKSLIGQDKHFRKQYVLGRIILKEEFIANSNHSPFRLPPGTKYYIVSVTSVNVLGEDTTERLK